MKLDAKKTAVIFKAFCDENRIRILELGLTFAQRSTDDKSNEISAVQELLKTLNIKGQMVTTDALNCQKGTANYCKGRSRLSALCER